MNKSPDRNENQTAYLLTTVAKHQINIQMLDMKVKQLEEIVDVMLKNSIKNPNNNFFNTSQNVQMKMLMKKLNGTKRLGIVRGGRRTRRLRLNRDSMN